MFIAFRLSLSVVLIHLQLKNGTISYVHPHQTVVFDEVLVNDGAWHYLETRWLPGEILITLDYGHFQVGLCHCYREFIRGYYT